MRLAMALVVRDELDIIEGNLRYHAAHGVDCFRVLDNGSVDGTRERLEELRGELDLQIVDEPARTLDQDLWMTALVAGIREEGCADWVILNDADELWVCASGDLKSELDRPVSLVEVPRQNLLARSVDLARPDYRFFHNRLRVVAPTGAAEPAPDPDTPLRVELLLRALPGKVIARVEEVLRIGMGNHDAQCRSDARTRARATLIYHYPMRSIAQFRAKVAHQGDALRRNPRHDRTTGWHMRRLYALLERGGLDAELARMVLGEARARSLEQSGVLRWDSTVADWFDAG